MTVTHAQLATGSILIELQPSGAVSPAQEGEGNDERRLGVLLYAAALLHSETAARLKRKPSTQVQPPPIILDLTAESFDEVAEFENWYPPEVDGRWTGQQPARVTLKNHNFTSELQLVLVARTLDLPFPEKQKLSVSLNGEICAECPIDNGRFRKLIFTLPAENVAASPQLRLELHCSYITSPAQVSGSSDGRQLGVLVRSLTLVTSAGGVAALKILGEELYQPGETAAVGL